jgi:hypothetical protein
MSLPSSGLRASAAGKKPTDPLLRARDPELEILRDSAAEAAPEEI